MLYGYNKTLDAHHVTDGSPIFFPQDDVPMPHVFFRFEGIKPSPPEKYMLPLHSSYVAPDPEIGEMKPIFFETSIINSTGYVDCK